MEIGFLFDLDGVIIDSERKYTDIWNTINEEFPTGVPDFARSIKGMTLENILAANFPDENVRTEVVKMLYRLEGEMIYEYLEHAEEFLERLDAMNIPKALVTSSNNKKMEHLWKDIPALKDKFQIVITGDMVSRGKPAPDGYLRAASLLGIAPERCVVVEDSLQGVKAGKNAGALVVGVAGTLPAEVIAPHSDFIVDHLMQIDLESILELLERNSTL